MSLNCAPDPRNRGTFAEPPSLRKTRSGVDAERGEADFRADGDRSHYRRPTRQSIAHELGKFAIGCANSIPAAFYSTFWFLHVGSGRRALWRFFNRPPRKAPTPEK
jgi:hypothetical protein